MPARRSADAFADRSAPERRETAPVARVADKRWPHKATTAFSPAQYRALRLAAVEDRVDVSARLRALVDLWMEDEDLRTRVLIRAGQEDRSRVLAER